jgi:hypothetical protein
MDLHLVISAAPQNVGLYKIHTVNNKACTLICTSIHIHP